MPQFQPFNYAQAVGQGTQNALNTLKARQGVRDVKRQNAIHETGQKLGDDYSYESHANALRKQGYTQAANALTQQGQKQRANRIQNELDGMKFIAATAPMASDQQSYERIKQRWVDLGIAEPNELPEQFDPNFMRSLQGKAEGRLSGSDLVKVQGPDGSPVFVPAEQAVGLSAYQEGEKPSYDAKNVLLPDGSYVRGRETGQGDLQIRGQDGSWQPAPRDARMVGTNITGSEEDVGAGKKEMRDLRTQEVNTKKFIATTSDALKMLEENPDINTWTARASSLINNLQQEAKALARQTGVEFDASKLDPSKHKETFDELGIQNPRMRSMVVSLAFQRALANNPGGRISEPDFQSALREIGANASDPRALSATLRDVANRAARGFRIGYETRLDKPYEGDLGLSGIQPQEPAQQPGPTREQAAQQPEVEVDEETQRLLEKYQ